MKTSISSALLCILGSVFLSAHAQPRPIRMPMPVFPQSALEQCYTSGTVTLEFEVDGKGVPTNVRVVSSEPRRWFDRAAIRAMKKARFAATGGMPVTSSMTLRFQSGQEITRAQCIEEYEQQRRQAAALAAAEQQRAEAARRAQASRSNISCAPEYGRCIADVDDHYSVCVEYCSHSSSYTCRDRCEEERRWDVDSCESRFGRCKGSGTSSYALSDAYAADELETTASRNPSTDFGSLLTDEICTSYLNSGDMQGYTACSTRNARRTANRMAGRDSNDGLEESLNATRGYGNELSGIDRPPAPANRPSSNSSGSSGASSYSGGTSGSSTPGFGSAPSGSKVRENPTDPFGRSCISITNLPPTDGIAGKIYRAHATNICDFMVTVYVDWPGKSNQYNWVHANTQNKLIACDKGCSGNLISYRTEARF